MTRSAAEAAEAAEAARSACRVVPRKSQSNQINQQEDRYYVASCQPQAPARYSFGELLRVARVCNLLQLLTWHIWGRLMN